MAPAPSTQEWDDIIKPDTGLTSEVWARIQNPVFEVDLEYARVILNLDFEPHDGADFNTIEAQSYGCGSVEAGWSVEDDGDTAVNENGKNFNQNSAVYALLRSLLAIPEAAEVLRERFDNGMAPFGPRSVGFWDGLIVFLVEEPFSFEDDDGNTIERSRLVVGEFGGVYGDKPAAAKKAPAKKKTPAKKAEPDTPTLDAKIKAALDEIADDCGDHAEFMERSYAEVDGLEDDEVAVAYVEDKTQGWQAAVERYEASQS